MNSTIVSGTASGHSYAHTLVLNADIILPDSSTHAQRIKREAHEVRKGKGERMPPGCSSLSLQIPVVKSLVRRGEK